MNTISSAQSNGHTASKVVFFHKLQYYGWLHCFITFKGEGGVRWPLVQIFLTNRIRSNAPKSSSQSSATCDFCYRKMGNLCPQLLRKNIPICNILQMNLSSVNLEKISHWHGGYMASFWQTQLLDPHLYGRGFVNPAGDVWDYALSDLSWYVTSVTTDTTPSSNFSLCVIDSKCFWSKYILTL